MANTPFPKFPDRGRYALPHISTRPGEQQAKKNPRAEAQGGPINRKCGGHSQAIETADTQLL